MVFTWSLKIFFFWMEFQITKNIQLVLGLKFIVGSYFQCWDSFAGVIFHLHILYFRDFFLRRCNFCLLSFSTTCLKTQRFGASQIILDTSVKVLSRVFTQVLVTGDCGLRGKCLVIRLNKQKFSSVGWHWDSGSALGLSVMSTCSSATFLDCQSTSKMYCLDLVGLCLAFHSNEVLGFQDT